MCEISKVTHYSEVPIFDRSIVYVLSANFYNAESQDMETLIAILQTLTLILGAILVHRQRFVAGLIFLELGLFVSGLTLAIDRKMPFTFLLSEIATTEDYINAIFGGALMCGVLSFLSIWLFAQISKMADSIEENDTNTAQVDVHRTKQK